MQEISLEDSDLEEIRALLFERTGIRIGKEKHALVVARLSRRLRHHQLPSFSAYRRLLREDDPGGLELTEMINCLTTNKTEFFREPHHFAYLERELVPELVRRGGPRRLRIWSAGCSTGQEPYSIAMVLAGHPELRGWDVKVLASDIDTQVLEVAAEGRYPRSALAEIPEAHRTHLAIDADGVRVQGAARELVHFRRINLVEEPWPLRTTFDAIFCRNVTIYFDHATQDRLHHRFHDRLAAGGHLFAGHSENLLWLRDLFSPVGNTVYRRAGAPPKVDAPADAVTTRNIVEGDVFSSRAPTEVTTVLGSCVSVCLYDPKTGVGGLNHFALPDQDPAGTGSRRFGLPAMEELLGQLTRLGVRPADALAKVVGGAETAEGPRVGPENVAFARRFLERHGTPIVAERTGEAVRLSFQTHTGRCRVWPIHEGGRR